jgi:hypothetical protein
MTRRDFIGFFLLGGALSLVAKKTCSFLKTNPAPVRARFWKKL